ncbi:FUSC family protein [Micromonospora sp. RHAY321]|uniref:FUSC family protein n=1 Tax=Micromonospora sp. RHAY321 TaxID=2944807 RepID=UPI00207CEE14|nr:FUSC family protein [Micromonospora sp. RHAY321]MCO1599452.1 FUSC family protein [Micromonospora sp. RHAY321]
MRSRRRGARPAESALREGRDAYDRLRTYLIVAVQAGLAAGLAWFIASDVLHNPQPLFAPAAAVGTIAAAIGNRARRTVELLAGVILGVLIGDGIIRFIGAGPIQTGLVVALTISAAALFRGTGAVMVQAGSTAVLLGTVSPERPDLAVPRTANALVGVLVAIVVALLILPLNPVRIVHRAAGPAVDAIAREMTATADALTRRDVRQAEEALQRLRTAEAARRNTTEMVAAACEVARLSPWRRRRLGIMRRYEHAAEHLELAYTNSREMVQWAVSAIRAREPLPAGLPTAIEHFGQAFRLLHRDFLAGREPDRARERALRAIDDVDEACAEGVEFTGAVVVTQLRVVISQLLQVSGLPRSEANQQAGLNADV